MHWQVYLAEIALLLMVYDPSYVFIPCDVVLFSGEGSRVDTMIAPGTTDLSRILRYGHYSPAGSRESITNFKKVNIIG